MADGAFPLDVRGYDTRRPYTPAVPDARRDRPTALLNPLREEPFFRWSILAYLLLRLMSFERGVERLGDTPSYLHAATLPVLSKAFLAGERSFTVPLLWKVVPGGTAGDVAAQVALSVVSWVFLALAVAAALEHPVARKVGLWLVLGLSLTNAVTTWDHDLLSESVSISLTAALLGAVLVLVRRPGWPLLLLTLVLACVWVFSRDSNAYAAVVVVPVLLVALVVRPQRSALTAVALLGTLAIVAASLASARAGGREEQPVRDVIFIRLRVEDPAAMAWLRAHGFNDFNANNSRFYRSYLLHHPLQALLAPLVPNTTAATYSSPDRIAALWTPDVAQYDRNHFFARVPRQIQDVLFPLRPVQLGLELLLVLAASAFAVRRGGLSPPAVVGFVALLSAYPQLVVVWNVSGQEIDRHALIPALVVRLGGILLAAFALDRLYQPVADWIELRAARIRTWVLRPEAPERTPST